MTELELYKFIEDNNVEIDWRGEQLVIWLHHMDLKDFCELIRYERKKGLQMDNKSLEQRIANIENMLLKLSVVILDLSEVIMPKTEETTVKE